MDNNKITLTWKVDNFMNIHVFEGKQTIKNLEQIEPLTILTYGDEANHFFKTLGYEPIKDITDSEVYFLCDEYDTITTDKYIITEERKVKEV